MDHPQAKALRTLQHQGHVGLDALYKPFRVEAQNLVRLNAAKDAAGVAQLSPLGIASTLEHLGPVLDQQNRKSALLIAAQARKAGEQAMPGFVSGLTAQQAYETLRKHDAKVLGSVRRLLEETALAGGTAKDGAARVGNYFNPAFAKHLGPTGKPPPTKAMPFGQANAGAGSSYARRIMVTETSIAHGQAVQASATVNGTLVRWLLSGAHAKPDACDGAAHLDPNGLGEGVYLPGAMPPFPSHPHCTCVVVEAAPNAAQLARLAELGILPDPASVPLGADAQSSVGQVVDAVADDVVGGLVGDAQAAAADAALAQADAAAARVTAGELAEEAVAQAAKEAVAGLGAPEAGPAYAAATEEAQAAAKLAGDVASAQQEVADAAKALAKAKDDLAVLAAQNADAVAVKAAEEAVGAAKKAYHTKYVAARRAVKKAKAFEAKAGKTLDQLLVKQVAEDPQAKKLADAAAQAAKEHNEATAAWEAAKGELADAAAAGDPSAIAAARAKVEAAAKDRHTKYVASRRAAKKQAEHLKNASAPTGDIATAAGDAAQAAADETVAAAQSAVESKAVAKAAAEAQAQAAKQAAKDAAAKAKVAKDAAEAARKAALAKKAAEAEARRKAVEEAARKRALAAEAKRLAREEAERKAREAALQAQLAKERSAAAKVLGERAAQLAEPRVGTDLRAPADKAVVARRGPLGESVTNALWSAEEPAVAAKAKSEALKAAKQAVKGLKDYQDALAKAKSAASGASDLAGTKAGLVAKLDRPALVDDFADAIRKDPGVAGLKQKLLGDASFQRLVRENAEDAARLVARPEIVAERMAGWDDLLGKAVDDAIEASVRRQAEKAADELVAYIDASKLPKRILPVLQKAEQEAVDEATAKLKAAYQKAQAKAAAQAAKAAALALKGAGSTADAYTGLNFADVANRVRGNVGYDEVAFGKAQLQATRALVNSGAISPEDWGWVKSYKSSDYVPINRFIRGKGPDAVIRNYDTRGGGAVSQVEGKINRALAQGRTTEDGVLWRGTNLSQGSFAKYDAAQVGDILDEEGYFSAATDRAHAWNHSRSTGVLWEVYCPQGTPGLHIDATGVNAGEREFLLPSNISYRVIEKTRLASGGWHIVAELILPRVPRPIG